MIKKTPLLVLIFVCSTLASCTSLFLQPSRERYPFVEKDGLNFESTFFSANDETSLNSWYFSSARNSNSCFKPKGLILQVHGNAENMSTHYRLLSWILSNCYDLMTFDYRGYGQSEGSKSISGSIQDTRAAIIQASIKAKELNIPFILYGQSLGGSLSLRTLTEFNEIPKPQAIIIEGSFYSYQQIAREKLALSWLTWWAQPLAYVLVSDRYQPGDEQLKKLKGIPTLIIHTKYDPVVPFNHGQQLFADLEEPKWFWTVAEPGHMNAMFTPGGPHRKSLLEWLDFTLISKADDAKTKK